MELLEARRNAAPSPRRAGGRRTARATAARTGSGRTRRKAAEA